MGQSNKYDSPTPTAVAEQPQTKVEIGLVDLCNLINLAFSGMDGRKISYSQEEKNALLALHQAIAEALPVDDTN